MNLKNILVRALSGGVYVGIIIGSIYLGTFGVCLLAILLGLLGTIELSEIISRPEKRLNPVTFLDCLGVTSIIIAIPDLYNYSSFAGPAILCPAIILMRLIFEIYKKSDDPIKETAVSMLKYCYLGIPLGFMTAMADGTATNYFLLAIFLLIWINDTGAYIIGCTFGRHRLFERLSPKKSWEGFFGGLGFSIILSLIFAFFSHGYFGLPGNTGVWIGLGIIVTVFSTWGDLFESMIKRSLNIKDSGNLIPGHGGILDRIDSLLFVMPAVAIYLYFLRT